MGHRLLERQLRRCGIGDPVAPPGAEAWAQFLQRVDRAYVEADEERYLLERSMRLSSEELRTLNMSLRRAEARHASDNVRLQTVISSLGDGLCVLDAEGRCLTLNPEGERLLGWTQAELAGAPLLRDGRLGPRFAEALPSARVREEDARFSRRDGRSFPVSYVLTPIDGADGPAGFVLVFRDISERKSAQQALEREHRQLRNVVANAPVAMAMLDARMRYVQWSQRWVHDWGLTERELLGRSHYDLIPDQPERWKEMHARALAGEVVTCPEDAFTRADGTQVHLRWAAHPWHSPDGPIAGLVLVTDRIDELVRARETALEASRLKAAFLANMSHEIRTPMNGVIGMADLLAETTLGTDQREFVENIRTSAETLLTIINDILDFSKIEAGKLSLETIDFDPAAVAQDVIEGLAERAQRKELEINCLVAPDAPRNMRGDPARLRQILINLVGNAVKFTDRGEVTLSLAPEPGDDARVRFEVRDTGLGIPEEAASQLFEAFYQVDASSTRRHGGTGLGLAICRQLAGMMGGEIRFESTPGRGSSFWVSLPYFPALAPLSPQADCAPELRGRRILVVDDNATNRRILQLQTSGWGMLSALAEDGSTALAMLRQASAEGRPFELMILDMDMPGMDGVQLAACVRAASDIAPPRMILLSSMVGRGARPDVAAAGIAACVPKPVRSSRLLYTLVQVLGAPPPSSAAAPELPPALPHAAGRAGPAGAPGPSARAPSVLLVEDNAVNRAVALRMLAKLHIAADVAGNGREAVEAVERTGYTLVLMDCQMPELDGFQATELIRRREASGRSRVPIVAMTAHAMSGDRERCLQAGMDDYLAKPFRLQQLAAVIARWHAVA